MNKKAIFLCGFMGCGKSTIGKLLAKKTGKNFTDLDIYIEEQQGMEIPDIFEKHGESYFRKIESECLSDFGKIGCIIATGGGALLTKENAEIAKNSGYVVFIDTPFEICYNRIKGDKNRPIAYNSTEAQLLERYNMRRPLYIENSDAIVDGKGTPLEIANKIIEILK